MLGHKKEKGVSIKVKINKGLKGCSKSKGVTVFIDVFRTVTTICCILKAGACEVLVGKCVEDFAEFQNDDTVECFSEINDKFGNHDNSPLAALQIPLTGKKAIIVSNNGTKIIHALSHCEDVYAAALVNIDAIAEYLIGLNPKEVSIVTAGKVEREEDTTEDNICAEFLKARLTGRYYDETNARKVMFDYIAKRYRVASRNLNFSADIDLALCSAIGIFDIIPKVYYSTPVIKIFDVNPVLLNDNKNLKK